MQNFNEMESRLRAAKRKSTLAFALCAIVVTGLLIGASVPSEDVRPPGPMKQLGILERLENLRHYHGVVDVSPASPLSIDVQPSSGAFSRVRLAIRSERFSTNYYSEVFLGIPSLAVTQPEFGLNMAYANLNPNQANQGEIPRAIVSWDWAPVGHPELAPEQGSLFHGTPIIYRSKNVAVTTSPSPPPAFSPWTDHKGEVAYTFATEVKIHLGALDQGVKAEDGKAEKDITKEFLQSVSLRKNVSWEKLGDGSPDHSFVKSGTGLIDITDILNRYDVLTGCRLNFRLENSGGRVIYDLICD